MNDLRGGDDPSLSKMVTRSRMASIDLEISQLDPNSSEFQEEMQKIIDDWTADSEKPQ